MAMGWKPPKRSKNHEKVTRVWFEMGAVNHDFKLKFQACHSQITCFLKCTIPICCLVVFGVVNDEFGFRNSFPNPTVQFTNEQFVCNTYDFPMFFYS